MKESFLGPRQWAFVVITGGAACALPFLQTDTPPTSVDNALTRTNSRLTPTDTALTNSQQGSAPAERHSPEGLGVAGGGLVVPGSVGDFAPPLAPQRLPEWANADRSPFDELVGGTAAKPQAAPPSEPLPMQPLRPWIAGPGDSASLTSNATPPIASSKASAAEGSIAAWQQPAAQATPWSDESAAGFTAIDQVAVSKSRTPGGTEATSADAARWPDQSVTAEQLAQVTRSRERELASAIVAPPRRAPNDSSALLAAPALPAAVSSQAVTTVPVAAQRFGQAYMPPESSMPRAATSNEAAAAVDRSSPDTKDPNLPVLPPARKSHIIFQPGNWK